MKTSTVIVVISTILIAVIGFIYYMYNKESSKNPSPIDPRTNLTNVIKGTIEKIEKFETLTAEDIKNLDALIDETNKYRETPQQPLDITTTVMPEFFTLIALVKKITGKEKISLCLEIPSKILSYGDEVYGDSVTKVSSMDIISKNLAYITKGAYKVAAENENFYDITALFFQETKVMMGTYPFPIIPDYDDKRQLSTVILYDGMMRMATTIEEFSKIFPKSIEMPLSSDLGNDPDLISFAGKMVPFYNSFVPTLSTMDQSMAKFDVNLFGKLMVCWQLVNMIKSGRYKTPFSEVCTSLSKEILKLYG